MVEMGAGGERTEEGRDDDGYGEHNLFIKLCLEGFQMYYT